MRSLIFDKLAKLLNINALVFVEIFMVSVVTGFGVTTGSLLLDEHGENGEFRYSKSGPPNIAIFQVYFIDNVPLYCSVYITEYMM